VAGRLLLVSAWALAALSVADLVFAVTGGETLIFGPIVGAVLGWLAAKRGASRAGWRLAVGANAAVLVVSVIAVFASGGT
jgi:hypothetical protein